MQFLLKKYQFYYNLSIYLWGNKENYIILIRLMKSDLYLTNFTGFYYVSMVNVLGKVDSLLFISFYNRYRSYLYLLALLYYTAFRYLLPTFNEKYLLFNKGGCLFPRTIYVIKLCRYVKKLPYSTLILIVSIGTHLYY